MKKEAIYTRQSIDKRDSVSIETQRAECEKLLTGEYLCYSDRGYSGKNTERPGLQQLLCAIQCGNISKVIVYRLDRISRNITDFYNLYETMKDHGCEFVSVSEAFDTSGAMGRAMMGIIAVFAQMERETIQQRIKDNYYFRITDGRWAGGPAPIGFDNARTPENQPTLKANEDIEMVKEAFNLYAYDENISLAKVADILMEKGYRAKGKSLWTGTISHILRNPVYVKADERLYSYYKEKGLNFLNDRKYWTGQTSAAIVGKTQGGRSKEPGEQSIYLTNFPGVTDSGTFILIQERLGRNASFGRANPANTRLGELSGLLKCAKCGYAIKVKTSYPTLVCDGRCRLHVCDASFKGVRLEDVRMQVRNYCQNFLDGKNHLKVQNEEKEKALYARAEKLEEEIKRIIDMAAESDGFAKAAVKSVEKRQDELTQIYFEISLTESNDMAQSLFAVQQRTSDDLCYDKLSPEKKQGLCRLLISKILLNEDGTVTIIPREI